MKEDIHWPTVPDGADLQRLIESEDPEIARQASEEAYRRRRLGGGHRTLFRQPRECGWATEDCESNPEEQA